MKNALKMKIAIVWSLRVLAVSAFFLLLAFELVYLIPPLGIAAGIISLLIIGIGGWYITYYFSHYFVEEYADRVCVSSGVIIRKRTIVFFSDTVTVTMTSSPIMRLLKLNTIILSLAGKRVRLYGISATNAAKIAAQIEKKGAMGCEHKNPSSSV